MPKAQIGTYAKFQVELNGKLEEVPVKNIFSEDEYVNNITKEVSVFEKYSSKKPLTDAFINKYGEIVRDGNTKDDGMAR